MGRVWLFSLFGLLLAVFLPNFSAPPRSDWWPLLYHFHAWGDLPVFERVIRIVNYDVCGHGTYRPLFHVLLYWMHLLFGSGWFWFHVLNFAFYCLSIILLYRLARELGAGRTVTLAFLTLFAFLFSHFDIVCWTFHIAVIAGFCLFLLGFLGYLGYLRSGRPCRLLVSMLVFLAGLLCYETFILWPPAVVVLFYFRQRQGASPPQRAIRSTIIALAGLYVLYAGIIGYTRSRSAVEGLAGAPHDILSAPSLSYTLAVTTSGLAFNTVAANLDPLLVSPGIIRDNISRGGVLISASPTLRETRARRNIGRSPSLAEPPLKISKGSDIDTLWRETEADINRSLGIGGSLLLLVGIIGGIVLWKRRRPRHPLPFIFALYLLLTGTFLLYHGRMATNIPIYVLLEFRYQYFPNAIVFLLAILAFDRLLISWPRLRYWVYPLLVMVFALNLLVLTVHLKAITREMEPLKRLLTNIKTALDDGRLHPGQRLYLDDAIAESLPSLCWNVNLAPYMEGTYQWIFPREQLACFAFNPTKAAWTIDPGNFSLKTLNRD